MALLTLSSLNFTYDGSTSPALKDVSLTVNEGDFILLCGNSGCGKTTLMRLIKPQLAPNGKLDGEILFDGRPLSSLTDREAACGIGYAMGWRKLPSLLLSNLCGTAVIWSLCWYVLKLPLPMGILF